MSENLTQKVYWHIHDKLTSGELEPGSRLSNRVVAKEIGISFTPVREALGRLASEGLLEYREGLGVFVPRATRRELEELYEVREMLECAVVARACGNLPEDILGSLHELQRQMWELVEAIETDGDMTERGQRLRSLDAAFHSTLIRVIGNRQLIDTMADLERKCAVKAGGTTRIAGLVGHVFETEPIESIKRTCREHDTLLARLAESSREDKEEARSLLKRHIRTGRQLALAAFDRMYLDSSRRAGRPDGSAEGEFRGRSPW